MNLHEFVRDFARISTGAKTVFSGATVALAATFLPWFQRVDFVESESGQFVDVLKIGNGFSFFAIFGVLSLAGAVVSLFLFGRHFFGHEKTLGIPNARLWIFIGGEILFALGIALFVFFAQMKDDTTAEVRFGFFLVMAAYGALFLGGYGEHRDNIEREQRSLFAPSVSPGHLNIRPEMPRPSSASSIEERQLSLSDLNGRK